MCRTVFLNFEFLAGKRASSKRSSSGSRFLLGRGGGRGAEEVEVVEGGAKREEFVVVWGRGNHKLSICTAVGVGRSSSSAVAAAAVVVVFNAAAAMAAAEQGVAVAADSEQEEEQDRRKE